MFLEVLLSQFSRAAASMSTKGTVVAQEKPAFPDAAAAAALSLSLCSAALTNYIGAQTRGDSGQNIKGLSTFAAWTVSLFSAAPTFEPGAVAEDRNQLRPSRCGGTAVSLLPTPLRLHQ